jgi:hypothetical protein
MPVTDLTGYGGGYPDDGDWLARLLQNQAPGGPPTPQSFVPGHYPDNRGVTFNTPPLGPPAQPIRPVGAGLSLNSNPMSAFYNWLIRQSGQPGNVDQEGHGTGDIPPAAPFVGAPPAPPTSPAPAPAPAPGPASPPQGPPGYLNSTSAIPALPQGFDVGGPAWTKPAGTKANAIATHAAAPQGSPSATPRPASAPNLGYYQGAPDNTFQWSTWSGRNKPILTAGNLGGLFNRGGAQAVNPNAPAPNAQPMSATAPNGPLDLGTSYNIPGSGYRISPSTGDVYGTLWGRSRSKQPYNPY